MKITITSTELSPGHRETFMDELVANLTKAMVEEGITIIEVKIEKGEV